MDFYPDAKVILTVRDDDSWIKSWNVLNNKVLKSFAFRFLAKLPYTSFKLQKDIHNKMILGKMVHLKVLKQMRKEKIVLMIGISQLLIMSHQNVY